MNRSTHRAAYGEAVRSAVGMAVAYRNGSPVDAQDILAGYHERCVEIGVPASNTRWAVLFGAAMSWVNMLVARVAEAEDCDPDELLQQMGVQAAAGTEHWRRPHD